MSIIKPTEYYDNCSDGISSDLVFKLIYWDGEEKETKGGLTHYKLMSSEYEVFEIIGSIFGVSGYTLGQVSIGIGLCGLSNYYYGLANSKKQLEYLCIDNDDIVNDIDKKLNLLMRSSGGREEVQKLISAYESNKYIAPIVSHFKITKKEKPSVVISNIVSEKLRSFVNTQLDSGVFGKKKFKEDDNMIQTRLPSRYRTMIHHLKTSVFDYEYTNTRIHQGCSVVGLYAISKMLLTGNNFLNSDEFGLTKFYSKLNYLYASFVPAKTKKHRNFNIGNKINENI